MVTAAPQAHVLVFGNIKGGSGKSTAAMHCVVGLLRNGLKVASIDVDAAQGTLTHYVENRRARAETLGVSLPLPTHRTVMRSQALTVAGAEREDKATLAQTVQELSADHDVVLIDSPGADTPLSRAAHALADTLVTPINDSFVDLDLLAVIDPDSLQIVRPSIYSDMVWEMRKERARAGRRPIDWIVMRNRLGHNQQRNKQDVAGVVETLQKRLGFRLAPGFGERVIFRELYLKGLTMLDIREASEGAMAMSHVAARQEVRALMKSIGVTKATLQGVGAQGSAGQGQGGAGGSAMGGAPSLRQSA